MDVKELFISQDRTIKEAMKKLDETAKKILLVVDECKLMGVITDGDTKKWRLR